MIKQINAVIFDMDGVVFDSQQVYYDAFFIAADELEIEVAHEFVMDLSGKSATDCQLILQDFFNNDSEKTQLFLKHWEQARLALLAEHGLDFKEGFVTLFDAIRQSGRAIGLVTSAYYEDVKDNFERNDAIQVGDFDHIITLEDVKYPKPDPQPYRMMMRQLGYNPENCLVIEDSLVGVTAALSAGANVIMLNEHIDPPADMADKLCYKTSHHDNILNFLQDNGLSEA